MSQRNFDGRVYHSELGYCDFETSQDFMAKGESFDTPYILGGLDIDCGESTSATIRANISGANLSIIDQNGDTQTVDFSYTGFAVP